MCHHLCFCEHGQCQNRPAGLSGGASTHCLRATMENKVQDLYGVMLTPAASQAVASSTQLSTAHSSMQDHAHALMPHLLQMLGAVCLEGRVPPVSDSLEAACSCSDSSGEPCVCVGGCRCS
jgi:hypothetical protein